MGQDKRLFRFDKGFSGFERPYIAGVDEAGRGPLAGPVVAAAVIFRRRISLPSLNDSKKVSPPLRKTLFRQIISQALVGIGRVPERVIDEINILEATRQAMRKAVLALPRTPHLVLIDGHISLDLPLLQVGIIRGDAQSAVVAAASVVAKVYRDFLMEKWDSLYPDYGFARHKGYPTPEHLRILQWKGPCVLHRKSFRPLRVFRPEGSETLRQAVSAQSDE